MSVEFKSLEEMAQKLEVLTMDDVKKLFTKEEAKQFHDHNDMAMVYAHTESKELIEELMSKYDLFPITYSVHDGDESSDFAYDTGFTYVHREGFLLCKNRMEGSFIETEENPPSDDESEEDE